jgi:hypothetical protein
MSDKILRMELRRYVFYPYENKEINTEQAIDETYRLFSDKIQSLIGLISSVEDMAKYAHGIDKQIPHFEIYKEGFITSLESLKQSLKV